MFADVKLILARPIVPKLLCFSLFVSLVWQLATGIFSLVSKHESVGASQPIVATVNQEALTASLNTPFFGDYVPQNLDDKDVKQSMLDLTVVGIMFADKEDASHVIIRMAGGREQTFSVGDSLPGGAIIKRITPDGILIKRNGALESLSLPKNTLIFEAPAKPLKTYD
jgi:general secretion pathway protein C